MGVGQIFVSVQDPSIMTEDLVLKTFSAGTSIPALNDHFNVWNVLSLFPRSLSSTCFGFRSRTWQTNIFGSGWNN